VLLVDANVLLCAVNERAAHHARSRAWLRGALDGEEAVAFTWLVLLAFLRLATAPKVFPRPLATAEAVATLEAWLAQPVAVRLEPSGRHLALVGGLLAEAGTAGNLVNDAHLAALAVEHDAEVVSFDSDFARFPGVRWRRPA
jgi:toxin-antitoxin system PIN domain toxin